MTGVGQVTLSISRNVGILYTNGLVHPQDLIVELSRPFGLFTKKKNDVKCNILFRKIQSDQTKQSNILEKRIDLLICY